jgi:hypothetical protein
MAKYSAPASAQRQANIAIALFMSSGPINPDQNMVLLRLEGRSGSLMQTLNLCKLSQLRRSCAAASAIRLRHRALALCWSMIFSENRYALFRTML